MAPVKETSDVSSPKIAKMDEKKATESEASQAPKESFKEVIKALEVLDTKFEEYYVELDRLKQEMEVKYDKLCTDLVEKRRKILNGEYKPTAEDLEYVAEDLEYISSDEREINRRKYIERVKGKPRFWLIALKGAVGSAIQKHDEPVLSHLKDIKMKLHDSPMGFTLEFHFTENEYFTDKVLTKYYERDSKTNFKGCMINWNKGKNLTLNYEEKKGRHDLKQLEIKPVNSFFNLFNSPVKPLDPIYPLKCQPAKEMHGINEKNSIVFQQIINYAIPRAIHYYNREMRKDIDSYRFVVGK